jgi:signal peptidase II
MPSLSTFRKPVFIGGFATIMVFLLDYFSKYYALRSLHHQYAHEVIPGFFNLTLTFNKGVAFGMFSQLEDWLRVAALSASTVVALGVLAWVYKRYGSQSLWIVAALGMVVGGAVGNLLDRLRYGAVIDFLDVYVGTWHWPAFNIADSGICVGVLILIFRCKD